VLNFFTSFGYFEKEEENLTVLAEIFRVLRPEGSFLIDLFNRERVVADLVPRETRDLGGKRVEIKRWFDPVSQRVNKRIRLSENGGGQETFLESVRAYRKEEVVDGLQEAGLEVTDVYGDFGGEPFDRDSERLILIGRKPA
jgi:ubiquinone/menaquinone biosynthesis C-methylase UbiE